MKQMDRRLLILMRLREERPVRAQDLAEECECSIRTIYRDIEALCQSGVPVAAMPGEGYRLVEGYHLPPIAFTTEEAVQMLIGLDIATGLGTAAQRESAKAAAAKVESVLTPQTSAEVARLRERIHVSGWARREMSPFLNVLHEGVVNDRAVWLRYHSMSPDQITERVIEPYSLVFYGGDWHAVGYCRLREDMRDFRASRILDAEVLDQTFRRSMKIFHDNEPEHGNEFDVRVWIDNQQVPWAREAPSWGFEGEEEAEGGRVFVFRVRYTARLLPWVFSWGAAARVTSPPDLVERARLEAQSLAGRYAEG